MTLRTRLTAAFLVVVLGPVMLGAAFVSYTMTAVARDRTAHQLEVAAGAVASAVAGLCQQLHTAAELLAGLPPEQRAEVAADLVEREPFAAVRISGPEVVTTLGPRPVPPPPWAECDGDAAAMRYDALAARVTASSTADGQGAGSGGRTGPADRRDQLAPAAGGGGQSGGVELWVAARIDQRVVDRLAAAAGAAVTLLEPGRREPRHTTDPTVDSTVAAAESLAPGELAESTDGNWVRRLEPAEGQPFQLVLAAPTDTPTGLLPALSIVVVIAGVLAVVVAWRLGGTTTRPLTELAEAADQVAEGDLAVRVPVRGGDEAGRLALAFNRMTHRTQAYVQALTASRDQLRRHLTVLGETLSSTHDLQRILRVILETAQAATGASAGAVLLIDHNSGTLAGQVSSRRVARDGSRATESGNRPEPADGMPEPVGGRVSVPLGEGLLGGVAATGEARRGRVGDRRMLHPEEPDCRTYVVVPISAAATVADSGRQPAVRGVLALYDRLGGDEFDDEDVSTLRTFAGQAAVAVDNVHAHEEAQRLSLTDPLTGLWNYRSLRESVRRELERASRFTHPLAALALDLDLFKDVNDAHGHPAGDAVLAEFAGRVRSVIREVDLAFRQGGEEFVILLPETDTRGAVVLAQRLGAAVRDAPVVILPRGEPDPRGESARGLPIHITVSIGIAVYPEHAVAPQDLLDAADDALYAAKRAGRDTYRVAPVRASRGGDQDQLGWGRRGGRLPIELAAAELPIRQPASGSDDDLPRAGRPAADQPPSAAQPPPVGGAQPPRQGAGG